MGMRKKTRRGGADRRRMQSKYVESDASDDDYKIEEDGEYDDSDEYCSSSAEEELEDDLVEEKKLRLTGRLKRRNGLPTKSRGRVGKACKERKVSQKEGSDEDYLDDDDDVHEVENSKDWGTGFPRRKRNGAKKVVNEKKASHMEDQNDDCEAEDGDDDDDEDYNKNGDDVDLWKVFPRRKRNGVQKPVEKKKAAYVEENDDAYRTEDDECDKDDDSDYNDNKDKKELRKCCPTRKHNGIQKVLKKKKDSYEDDDYEAEEDDCDDEDDYGDTEDEKDLPEVRPTRKQNGVRKALKKKKVAYREESDDDYEVEDDDCDDEDDYENGEEVEEDFPSDEIDFDDEDEVVVKKAKKVRQEPSHGRLVSGGRKKRNNSRVISESKRKTPAKRRGFQRKISFRCRKEATREKSKVKETNLSSSGPKRRRLVVDSDSDFVDEPLLVDEEYTISEEEREQVQEASRLCGQHLRNSSKKRSRKEANLPRERKHKARKGKDKVEESKTEAAKQVCGICLSEEARRTVRGTLDCCSHYFCFNCIMDWSKVESRCPLCKQRFATISKLGRSDTASDLRTTVISVPERDQVYQPSEEELRAYLDPYENVICTECHHGGDDANMLLCDLCDSPAHTYCVGLTEVPEGNWYCEGCRPTVLGPSISETPTFTRTTNELVPRSSSSENVRVAIDLNRAYEPETPLGEGIGMSSSPRPVDGDLRAGSSTLGVGVQTVSERRRRHQMAHFTSRTGTNVGLGPEVEWGRTRRFVFQNATRPNTSAFDTTFSQGLLHAGANVGLGPDVEWGRTRRLAFQSATRPDTSSLHTIFSQGLLHNFVSPAPNMHLLPAAPSNSGARRVWGQTLTGVGSSANGSGLLPAGLAGIRSGDAWSNYGHSPMQ